MVVLLLALQFQFFVSLIESRALFEAVTSSNCTQVFTPEEECECSNDKNIYLIILAIVIVLLIIALCIVLVVLLAVIIHYKKKKPYQVNGNNSYGAPMKNMDLYNPTYSK